MKWIKLLAAARALAARWATVRGLLAPAAAQYAAPAPSAAAVTLAAGISANYQRRTVAVHLLTEAARRRFPGLDEADALMRFAVQEGHYSYGYEPPPAA